MLPSLSYFSLTLLSRLRFLACIALNFLFSPFGSLCRSGDSPKKEEKKAFHSVENSRISSTTLFEFSNDKETGLSGSFLSAREFHPRLKMPACNVYEA